MEGAVNIFDAVQSVFAAENWGRVEVPYPMSWPAFAVVMGAVALPVLLTSLVRRLLFKPFLDRPLKIFVHDDVLVEDSGDWNVVTVRRSDWVLREPFKFDKNKLRMPVTLKVRTDNGVRACDARLQLALQQESGTIAMNIRLAKELGIVEATASVTPGDRKQLGTDREFSMSVPTIRLPIFLLYHPDPDVRLQIRLAVIGILAPLLFSYLLQQPHALPSARTPSEDAAQTAHAATLDGIAP